MIELISRESLLKKYDAEHKGQPGRARQLIEEEPTIEKRKTGKWVKKVDDGVYWYECSECGDYPLKSAFGYDYFSEWCPHCGAKLEGAEECQR